MLVPDVYSGLVEVSIARQYVVEQALELVLVDEVKLLKDVSCLHVHVHPVSLEDELQL